MPTTLVPSSTPSSSQKIGPFTVYREPRISANQLAQYLVSDHAKQELIVRDSKCVGIIPVANYQPARTALARCFDTQAGIAVEAVIAQAVRMETTVFSDPYEAECNTLSAAAMRRLAQFSET